MNQESGIMVKQIINKNPYSIFHLPYSIQAGFTLIEMLVVISIIGLLATLSLTSFTSTQKQARDTKRKNDLKQYQSALTGYAAKNGGFYPSRDIVVSATTTLCSDLSLTTCSADPKDPTPRYNYISNGAAGGGATATSYVLYATLENATSATYWLVCSNGKTGPSASIPGTGTCPL